MDKITKHFINQLPSTIFAYGSIHMAVIGDAAISVSMMFASGICLILNMIAEDKNE
ncbi:MAG: hypothetical protein IPO71_10925 [Nitrosomonas sp.]|mgnify:CR=1 FL=1|jgi:hypothetical protein|nr:hypothetical protein [Nitrosomonas sp.]